MMADDKLAVTQEDEQAAREIGTITEERHAIVAEAFARHRARFEAQARLAGERAGEWQDIASAPRDGTAIILAASHGVSVGWWEDSEPRFKWRFVDGFDLTPTGCCDREDDDRVPCNGMVADSPTHWQPLPEPPILKEAASITTGGEA